jgi:hypothetical protein
MSLVIKKIEDPSHLQLSDESCLLLYYYNDQLYVKRYMDIEDIPLLKINTDKNLEYDNLWVKNYLIVGTVVANSQSYNYSISIGENNIIGNLYTFSHGNSVLNYGKSSFSSGNKNYIDNTSNNDYIFGNFVYVKNSKNCFANAFGSGNIVSDNITYNNSAILENSIFSINIGDQHKIKNSNYATIFNGKFSNIDNSSYSSVINGNTNNITSSNNCIVGGGYNNSLSYTNNSIIVGGFQNIINKETPNIPYYNNNSYSSSFSNNNCGIILGNNNTESDNEDVLISNSYNSMIYYSKYSYIASTNNSKLSYSITSAIIGGNTNKCASSENSLVLGGFNNSIYYAQTHTIENSYILGGKYNSLNCDNSAVIGGNNNDVSDSNNSYIINSNDSVMFEANHCSIIGSSNVSLSNSVSYMTLMNCKNIDIDYSIPYSVGVQSIKFYPYMDTLPEVTPDTYGFMYFDFDTQEMKLITSSGVKTFQLV